MIGLLKYGAAIRNADLPTIFVRNLEKVMKKRRLSAGKLALMMGISSGFIYEILKQRKRPGLATIEKIAVALGIEPAELLKRGSRH